MEGMKAAKLNRRMKKFITRPQDGGALLPAFLPSDRHCSRKINNARSGSRSKEKSEPSQRDQGVPVFFRDQSSHTRLNTNWTILTTKEI